MTPPERLAAIWARLNHDAVRGWVELPTGEVTWLLDRVEALERVVQTAEQVYDVLRSGMKQTALIGARELLKDAFHTLNKETP